MEVDNADKGRNARVGATSEQVKEAGLVFVASHPTSVVAFLLPHIRVLQSLFPVTVYANSNENTLLQKSGVDAPLDFVPIVRRISPWSDIRAMGILYRRFRQDRPLAVHTITPKAGLLGITAAWLARVPVRVHSFTGQVWVTRTGYMRWILKAADMITAALSTDVLVDSSSQRDFLISEGVVTHARSSILGDGSICGVDTERFSPNDDVRKAVRSEMGTAFDAVVCLYLGRLNRDKGVLDLANAYAEIAHKHPRSELWVVGPDESDYFNQMQEILCEASMQVKRMDYTSTPERFLQAADLLCLPSYREGFGSSVIEAAACGVATLASRIYGLTDAIVEGQTGWMCQAGDVQELAQKLDQLLANPVERSSKGKAARIYVKSFFEEETLTGAMLQFYRERLL